METLVLTVIGADRPGLVELLSRIVHDHSGNWEGCRMAHLADRFAGVVVVRVPAARVADLSAALRALEQSGLKVTVERGGGSGATPSGQALHLELVGGDRPGITRAVTHALAERRVNVEELETDLVPAPDTGGTLFRLSADLRLPEGLDTAALRRDLEAIAADLVVDLQLRDPRA